ncbi:hypothetical protein GN956_G10975 [Arapaima gigas]
MRPRGQQFVEPSISSPSPHHLLITCSAARLREAPLGRQRSASQSLLSPTTLPYRFILLMYNEDEMKFPETDCL